MLWGGREFFRRRLAVSSFFKKFFIAALFACALSGGYRVDDARAGAGASASAPRPSPSLDPLDYPYCRALAWIEALLRLEKEAPAFVASGLANAGLTGHLSRLALCALSCPVESVTPDNAGDETSVFLSLGDDETFEENLKNPLRLIIEMDIVAAMETRINYLARHWPPNLEAAREEMPALKERADALDALWQARGIIDGGLTELGADRSAELERVVAAAPESAALWYALAWERVKAGLPQSALEAADKAAKLCGEREKSTRNDFLLANIYYAKALAHWQMDQTALALVDLAEVLKLLEGYAPGRDLTARALLARGEVYRLRDEPDGMCRDFSRACALGKCQEFYLARGSGECEEAERPGDESADSD